jgi:translation initiation factor 1
MSRGRDSTVYSSELGRLCPHCGLPTKRCQCRANPRGQRDEPAGDGVARVRREKRGRGGKTVTTVTGIPLAGAELKDLGKQLRRQCGTGGTVKDNIIEIQGDHADTVMSALEERGFQAKRAGG